MPAATESVRELLRRQSPPSKEDAGALLQVISGPHVSDARQEVTALAAELQSGQNVSPSLYVRAGIGLFLLGQHRNADACLSRAPGDPLGEYYHGLVLIALGRPADAIAKLETALSHGFDAVEVGLRLAECYRLLGQLDEADAQLKKIAAKAASRAEYSFQTACILADKGDPFGAIEYFERAVDMDPHHSRALFRLAAENALRGNDDEAVKLYERSLSKPPHHLGALLNLGLLYEDRDNYAAAAYCFRRILDVDPTHARARMYLLDIEANANMYYDEDSARDAARLQQLLSRPIADFELSVRSRNCLQSMGIETLGDLTQASEQDLLGGKNFGETSLQEIREMLTSHGLRIGQHRRAPSAFELTFHQTDLSPQEQVMLNKPVSELNLSVRARKCMARLGISTVAELLHRTADELLSSRNFGVTSLNEIRAKLSELDLKLRND